MSRNRVIYQSEALFASQKPSSESTSGLLATDIKQLHRVQSANYAFNISRTDVNQYGELAAIDRVVLETPTVSLDFSYYLANFANEEALGFNVAPTGTSNSGLESAVSKIINKDADEKNYFIKTVGEGKDAVSEGGTVPASGDSVIGIGNAFMTSYSVEAAVGSFPTVSVSAEGMNMRFDTLDSSAEGTIPSLDKIEGSATTNTYKLPSAKRSAGDDNTQSISTLRPGDIKVSLVQSAKNWLVTQQDEFGAFDEDTPSIGNPGESNLNDYDLPGVKLPSSAANSVNSANIQSFNISFDLSRTPIQRLGNRFAFAREIDFPVNITASFEAILTELTDGTLSDLIDCEKSYDLKIDLYSPKGCQEDESDSFPVCTYIVKDLKPDSQSFSSSIGDNKTVSIEFTSQIGGPNQKDIGLFMRGVGGDNDDSTGAVVASFLTAVTADHGFSGGQEHDLKLAFGELVKKVDGSAVTADDFVLTYNEEDDRKDTVSTQIFAVDSEESSTYILRFNDVNEYDTFINNSTAKLTIATGSFSDLNGNVVGSIEGNVEGEPLVKSFYSGPPKTNPNTVTVSAPNGNEFNDGAPLVFEAKATEGLPVFSIESSSSDIADFELAVVDADLQADPNAFSQCTVSVAAGKTPAVGSTVKVRVKGPETATLRTSYGEAEFTVVA